MNPFTSRRADSVAALGENAVIQRIRKWLGPVNPPAPAGIGDDCAVLPSLRGPGLITVDPVVFGKHFDTSVSPRAVGAKLLKRNLSDIAAMGGRPTCAVISIALAPTLKTRWLEQFYRGLALTAKAYGVQIVGGDIAQADRTFVGTLTLLGAPAGKRVLTRAGARQGDWVFVTGELGGSLLGHHFSFEPRLREAAWLASQRAVRAMMDVSDGLAKDLPALTPSDSAAVLDASAIPIAAAAVALGKRSGKPALTHALSDGEDFELLFALAGDADRTRFEKQWRARFDTRLTCIGRFERRSARRLPGMIRIEDYRGYEHLR